MVSGVSGPPVAVDLSFSRAWKHRAKTRRAAHERARLKKVAHRAARRFGHDDFRGATSRDVI